MRERTGPDGAVVTPLDRASLHEAIDVLLQEGVEAVAVCFLFSFLRPEHERALARRLRAEGLFVSANAPDPEGARAALAFLISDEAGLSRARRGKQLVANKAAYQATQLQGGYGFIQETDATRHYQDARILTVGEGTSEVQRMLIARGLGLGV